MQIQSGFTIQKSEFEETQEFGEKRFFRSPENYGYISMSYNPSTSFNIAVTENYTGKMLVPYFGPKIENPNLGRLNNSDPFFDAGLKLSHNFSISDDLKIEINGGIKNIFNSFQNDFDFGIDRDPSYIYNPTSPRTIYFGIKIGNIL